MSGKLVIASLCAALLSGCGAVINQTFDLNPIHTAGAGAKAAGRHSQILVANPGALKALDGQDIVIRGADGSIAYLKKAQWSDRLTNIVQMRLVQALEDTGHFAGVGRPGDGLSANYQLLTDMRVFGVDVNKSGKYADVQITAKLMDDKTGNIRKMKVFTARQSVTGRGNAAYAEALDKAFSAVMRDITRWTVQSL